MLILSTELKQFLIIAQYCPILHIFISLASFNFLLFIKAITKCCKIKLLIKIHQIYVFFMCYIKLVFVLYYTIQLFPSCFFRLLNAFFAVIKLYFMLAKVKGLAIFVLFLLFFVFVCLYCKL